MGLFFAIFLSLQAPLVFADSLSACSNLSIATTYTLSQDVSAPNSTCFNFTAPGVTLDCKGHSIAGSNSSDSIGIYSNQPNSTIKNCQIQNFSTGIYINSSANNSILTNNTVSQTYATDCYSQGVCSAIFIDGANYSQISGNTLSAGTASNAIGINLYSSAYTTLRDNIAILNDLGFYLGSSESSNLTNNYAYNSSTNGFYLSFSSNNNLTNNYAYNSSTTGFRLDSSEGNNLISNNATLNSAGFYIYSGSNNNTLTNNNAYNSNTTGVLLSSSSNNNLTGNYMQSNSISSSYGALYLSNSASNILTNNTLNSTATGSNVAKAAYLKSGQNNRFTNNTFYVASASSTPAIYTMAASGNNTFLYNNLTASIWVNDSNGTNFYNSSSAGNIYYFANGTPSWESYEIYSVSPSVWASTGAGLPLNASNAGSNWVGFGADWHPYSTRPLIFNRSACSNLSTSALYTLSQDVSANSTCFNILTSDVTLDCQGHSITGSNVSGSFGILSNWPRTIIQNCVIRNFSTGVMFSGSNHSSILNVSSNTTFGTCDGEGNGDGIYLGEHSSEATLSNVNASSVVGIGLRLSSSQNANINSVSTSSITNAGIYLDAHSNNVNLSNSRASTSGSGASAFAMALCTGSRISNSTFNSSIWYATYIFASSSYDVFSNNTFISGNGTSNLVYLDTTSGDNTFYLNNFSATSGLYVNDLTNYASYGANVYSYTVNGLRQGNIYANVANKSVSINGTNASSVSGFYVGSSGSGYPYNSTTSLGKVSSNVVDSAPLFPVVPNVFGNASTIHTSGDVPAATLSVLISGINASDSQYYPSASTVNISADGQPLFVFGFNFSVSSINFSQVSIEGGRSSGRSYASISGINSSALTGGKTLYLYNASTSYTQVCVKDAEGVSYSDVSSTCTDTNEHLISCNGTNQSGYTCTLSGTTLTISGLNHSAAMQYAPASSTASPSGGSSYSLPTLAYSFDCASGALNVSVRTAGGSAISDISVTLADAYGSFSRTQSSDSDGLARFSVPSSGSYRIESAARDYYTSAAITPGPVQLVRCARALESSPNSTSSAPVSEPSKPVVSPAASAPDTSPKAPTSVDSPSRVPVSSTLNSSGVGSSPSATPTTSVAAVPTPTPTDSSGWPILLSSYGPACGGLLLVAMLILILIVVARRLQNSRRRR